MRFRLEKSWWYEGFYLISEEMVKWGKIDKLYIPIEKIEEMFFKVRTIRLKGPLKVCFYRLWRIQ